jgi:hypothetical protein
MSVTSGKGGKLSLGATVLASLGSWKITETGSNPAHHMAAASGGAKTVLAGIADWSGTAQVYNKNNEVTPGAGLALIGYNGEERSTGNIVVTDLSVDCDISTGAWITQSIGFAGNGALAHAAGATLTDNSVPPKESSIGGLIKWTPYIAGTAGAEVTVPDIEKWSLKVQADVSAYVSSTSAPWTARAAGSSILSASFSFTFLQSAVSYLSASATRMTPRSFGLLKLYTSATDFWLLDQVCIDSNSDMGPDVEGGDYNRVTVSGQWTSYANVSGTMTAGNLKNPANTALWP